MSDTAERVKNIVVEHLGVDAEKVTEGASFIDDLGANTFFTGYQLFVDQGIDRLPDRIS